MDSHSSSGKMGISQIALFCMCAVIVLETLTASASIGPSGLFWWGITLIFFIVPYSLITSELGTAYPAEGGIYDWIRRAFGARMSTRAVYLYWLAGAMDARRLYFIRRYVCARFYAGTFPDGAGRYCSGNELADHRLY